MNFKSMKTSAGVQDFAEPINSMSLLNSNIRDNLKSEITQIKKSSKKRKFEPSSSSSSATSEPKRKKMKLIVNENGKHFT